jgi:hypothetical protein
MIKLSKDIKQMLTGLAYQDAGDFLSIREKIKVLGKGSENQGKSAATPPGFASRPAIKRIAFISDGRGVGAPLDYAIDACERQNAQIDLLIHGPADSKIIAALENRIKDAGISYQQIQLETDAVDGIIEYIVRHPSLIYLIAISNDDVARDLIEDVLPRRRRRIQVPVVLIEDQSISKSPKRSAA